MWCVAAELSLMSIRERKKSVIEENGDKIVFVQLPLLSLMMIKSNRTTDDMNRNEWIDR